MRKAFLTAVLVPLMMLPVYAEDVADTGCGFENEGEGGLIGTCGPDEEKKEVVLTGELGFEELRQQPGYEDNFAAYQPDAGLVSALQRVATPTELVVIVGTWCTDCHRETPRLAKVLDEANNPNITIRYIGVDRSRTDLEGLAMAYDFERIPTIIVHQGGEEIGRIVETPEVSLEYDLLRILRG